jgi:hypothetical protein
MTWFKLTALAVSRAFHILLHITDSGLSILHALVATNLVSSAFLKRNNFGNLLQRNGVNGPACPIFRAAFSPPLSTSAKRSWLTLAQFPTRPFHNNQILVPQYPH